MFGRSTRARMPFFVLRRNGFATRSEFDPPRGFDMRFKPYKAPFFSWKLVVGFGAVGAYLAYSELLFEKYAQFTEVDKSGLLPVQLEFKLKTLPIYQQLTKTAHGEDWVMMKSYENLDRNVLESNGDKGAIVRVDQAVKNEAEYEKNSLTSHTLAQPGGIAVTPIIFHNQKTNETITIVHMGYRLCGYPFIVHGGMLATLLNETFKRNASLRHDAKTQWGFLKDDYKVEDLIIKYRKPALANQFFVVRTERISNVTSQGSDREEKTGQPVSYKSTIESEDGSVLVEAYATLRNTGRASQRLSQEKLTSRWALF